MGGFMSQFGPSSQPGWDQSERDPLSSQLQQASSYPPQQETKYPQQPIYSPVPPQPFPQQTHWQQLPVTPDPSRPSLPQPPKKQLRRNIWITLIALVLIIAAVVGLAQMTTHTSPLSPDDQATATAMSSQQTAISSDAATAAAIATVQASQNTTSSTPVSQPTDTPIAQPTSIPTTPAPTFITFGDGNYQVGTDIQPGTYRTQSGSSGCYYERLKGFSGTVGDIIANNDTDYPAIVTILPGDKGFTSQNCGTWTSDLSQITTSTTTFDDGMYIVGTDIAPGTYKNTASQGCYYARLSGFSNTIDSIIANNNTDSAAIITIAASDKGFESQNCGTWTKI